MRVTTDELMAIVDKEWRSALSVGKSDENDSFFEWGGHSLLFMQLLWRLDQRLGVSVRPEEVHRDPRLGTIRRAYLAAAQQEAHGGPSRLGLRRAPLSLAQARMWTTIERTADPPHFNVGVTVRLPPHASATDFSRALATVRGRHEILRTRFDVDDEGLPVQVIQSATEVACQDVQVPADPAHDAAARIARALLAEEFDLLAAPAVRAAVLHLPDADPVGLVMMHHILFDGWSERILMTELRELMARPDADLPALPVQYADYAAWQRTAQFRKLVDADLEYWERELAGVPTELEYPDAPPRPPVQAGPGVTAEAGLDPDATTDVANAAARLAVSAYALTSAAYRLAIARAFGLRDVLLAANVNSRASGLDRLIGLFATTAPVRNAVVPDESVSDVASREHAAVARALTHRFAPFDEIRQRLDVPVDPSRYPLVQARMVFEGSLSPDDRTDPEWFAPDGKRLRSDLSLFLRAGPESTFGRLVVDERAVGPGAARRLADEWYRAVAEVRP